jgi:hypothetical protein
MNSCNPLSAIYSNGREGRGEVVLKSTRKTTSLCRMQIRTIIKTARNRFDELRF